MAGTKKVTPKKKSASTVGKKKAAKKSTKDSMRTVSTTGVKPDVDHF